MSKASKPAIDISSVPNGATIEVPEQKPNSPWWIKTKGLGKLAFGALVLLQPHYAFLIGMGTCTAGVAVHAYRKHPERSWGGFMSDMWNKPGEVWKDVKDAFSMEAGATLGLLAPYAGMAIAAFGALSYLGGNAQGVEGVFKGAAMATTVGTVGLPIIAGAFMVEGLCNSLGHDVNLISRGFGLAKSLVQGVQKIVGFAERNPEAPSQAVGAAVKEVSKGVKAVSGVAIEAAQAAQPTLENVARTVNDTPAAKQTLKDVKSSSFVGRFTSGAKALLGLSNVERLQQNQANLEQKIIKK
jgi:hypothetical protein